MPFDFQDFQEKSRAIERKHAERMAAILKQHVEETAAREAAKEKQTAAIKAAEEKAKAGWVAFTEKWDAILKRLCELEAAKKNEKALQCLNVRPTIDEHVLAKKIELPSSQSNGEDFPLDEPTFKEEIPLSINDKEPEVEAAKILDNNPDPKTDVVPQETELEDRTEQSILEDEIGSNIDDGEPQIHMKGVQEASFPMQDIYVDTGQMHGGHGVTRLLSLIHHHDQGHDQLKFCLITGHYQEAAPGHDKLNYTWCGDIPRPIRGFTLQYNWSLCMQVQRPNYGFSIVCGKRFYTQNCKFIIHGCKVEYSQGHLTLVCSRDLVASKHDAHGFHIFALEAEVDSLDYGDSKFDFDTEPIYDEYDEDYMLVHLSHNHIPQEFNPSEALDMVLFHKQCVAIPDKTMHYDMIVGDKADLFTIFPLRMQLKIRLCRMTKMLGEQQGSPYELPCPNFQFVDTKQPCSTLGNSRRQESHAENITATRLVVKHRWPPDGLTKGN